MIRISANLGFLWNELPLADAIRKAREAGFDAVECHWPYGEDGDGVKAALDETGLPMLGLNTAKGQPGEFGLSALPGRQEEARATIDKAVDYATRTGARAVHVMAGITDAADAGVVFRENLVYACELAGRHHMTILIEPLNTRDVPGYFLTTLEQAADIIERVGRMELKIMFDCYHMQIMGGDLLARYRHHRDAIGHVQFAAVPSRAEPGDGEVAFEWLLPAIAAEGYEGFFGAEYKPSGQVEDGLDWMKAFRPA
ncbi:TIM barrel protein [Aquamicrobium sp. LC103]|uniref:hydroxypyruvate isomerase family protein n=1 Tax=Aquamicrobium sp. LC103 TaxID=1120658 RepID=UPI00063E8E00|nr:TIM barrel protein [Aquamicrobium sp. LC103]TKT74760.1 TIM barrel protein [Aquamicrobium sp. LC103]